MSKPIIDVRQLSKSYRLGTIGATSLKDEVARLWRRARGRESTATRPEASEFWALRDVSFGVQPGEVVGIIGTNGAGKSTLLKILSRITQQTSGEVTLRGRVASLLEVGTGFHPDLTGRENIFLNGAILGMSKAEIRRKFDEIVAFSEVEQFIDTPVKRYSSGMYVRLAFAVAAHLEPEILIVDEVLAVGDLAFQKKCLGKIGAVGSQGRTVLFVSHNLLAIQSLCQRAVLLDQGRVCADGRSDEVVNEHVSQTAKKSTTALAERNDRLGTGAIRFTSVGLLDGNGNRIEVFRSGDPAVLRIGFENCTGRDLGNVLIGVGIDDSFGQRITHFTTDSDPNAPHLIPRDARAVDVRVERLPLMPGRYGFSLFFGVRGVTADWIQNAGHIDIEPGDYFGTGKLPHGHGHILVDHQFVVVPPIADPSIARVGGRR